jgi:hypothetical protein
MREASWCPANVRKFFALAIRIGLFAIGKLEQIPPGAL